MNEYQIQKKERSPTNRCLRFTEMITQKAKHLTLLHVI